MTAYDGSTPHPDPQRETFCQELIAGEFLYAAYEAAGFKRPRGNAQRMQQEPEVVARLKYLAERVAALGLDEILMAYRRNEHRRALEHIATADRLEVFEQKRGGRVRLKPLSKLTADQRALIDGLEIDAKGAVKVLMPKRLDARSMLAKLDGFDKPVKIAPTDPTGEHAAQYFISEHPMSEAEWEAQRAGAD